MIQKSYEVRQQVSVWKLNKLHMKFKNSKADRDLTNCLIN